MTLMRILLVLDFSPGFERKVAEFAARGWPPDTIVRVLSIAEKIPPSAAELWFDAQGSLKEVMKGRREKAEEIVLKASTMLREKGLTVETVVRTGRRRRTIAQEAKSWKADLIVRS